jgi:ATP-dependent Clp protease ATP-binding subunit ClpB
MNFNQFTIKAQSVLQEAHQYALKKNHPAIEPTHLLHQLFIADEAVINFLIKKCGANASAITNVNEKLLKRLPVSTGGEVTWSNVSRQKIQVAIQLATQWNDEFVTIEHLLAALTNGKDEVALLLTDAGLNEKNLKEAITALRKGSIANNATADDNYQSLTKFAKDLNKLAAEGKLDPVIGRDDEIRRVLQILSRRTKNNPILIGEPGVGKTAIAEGLAHRIINADVPENLKNKKIFSLDMGALIAGAKYKGEFEDRLKSVVKEVINAEGEIVLFIDEIHTLVGAGGGDGAMDAANILKPALARGELRAIGATTLNEYQKYIEKDKALERRFQNVIVDEPQTLDAISILRGIKDRYESHHRVSIKDEAIIAAVELSERYISDRFLPDKAIDLIDEAASKLRMEIDSLPEELDELNRKVMQLEIEREAIKREDNTTRLNEINEELANLIDSRNALKANWENEKNVVAQIQINKDQIEQYKQDAERAEREGDFGKVAELRYGKIKETEKLLKQLEQDLASLQTNGAMIKEVVSAEDIAEVVSKWTGIPVTKMLQSEREKLLKLETELGKRVIGQQEAIEALSDAIRRSRAGLQDAHKPIGSFIFLGTTGVGKTELAKALAGYLFNDDTAMVRIDMSEYQEKHAVSRLVGAPPGYVGYDEGGQLTEAIRRKPYAVVLLDEIEKAHPDVFNILLQVLDDGRLTDNKGRTANFRNTIIIMTSNIGADLIQEEMQGYNELNKDDKQAKAKIKVFEKLKKSIRPEFLNRIDEVIMFSPLTRDEITAIAKLQFENMSGLLLKSGIAISASMEAIDWLAQLGYDPQFGARPLKRIMQKKIINELSKLILAGKINKDDHVWLDVNKHHEFEFISQKAKVN